MRVRHFVIAGWEHRYIHYRNLAALIQITVAHKVKGWTGEIFPTPLENGMYYVGLHRRKGNTYAL